GFHFAGDYAFNLGVGFQSIPHNLGKSWFACIDDFTDRATYDLYATVENSKKAIGGGMLIGSLDNGDGTTTWHWSLTQDIPTYLESLTIGDYVLNPDEYFGIQDTIPIDIYSRPQDTANISSSFLNLKQILRIFEDHFGAYPFDRIGYSATSLGAMEHATNISYPYSGFNGSTSSEWWYAHELSHMWFGDMLTCSTAEDMWLNEGWATFCQIFYTEILYSEEDYKLGMRDKLKDVLMKTHIIDNGYYALNDIPQQYTYGSTAYDKGCVVTGALRTYLGDSIFFDGISAYLQNFAYQSVSSYQMRDFLSQHTGIDMTGFFDNWVFTPGTPHYSIDSTSLSANGNNYQLDIWLKQKHKGYDFIGNDNIVQIGYLKNDFTLEFDTVIFSGLNGHSTKTLEFQPVAILIDPEERMMDALLIII
ncbi:MAG: M1 family metallopeptidase, partial [Chlorobi bacterium]|nr:M1 family metallopeptidase [Chlorobiota bacterium]